MSRQLNALHPAPERDMPARPPIGRVNDTPISYSLQRRCHSCRPYAVLPHGVFSPKHFDKCYGRRTGER